MIKRVLGAFGLAILVASAPARAADDEPPEHRLVWEWNRFNVLDYVSTALLGAAFLAIELGTETPEDPNWRGGILFDDAVRDALVGSTRGQRDAHAIASDYLTLTPQVLMVFDSVGVPLFTDDWNYDVAWQLLAIDLQVMALTGVLSRSGHHFIGRERPDLKPCEEDNDYHGKCFGGTNASFPSGHTSGAFSAAGVNCVHHFKLSLYGNEVADASACAVGLTMASIAGVERLIADRHWATDVIVGAGLGLGAGVALPLVLHYQPKTERTEPTAIRWTIAPPPDGSLGLSVYGWM